MYFRGVFGLLQDKQIWSFRLRFQILELANTSKQSAHRLFAVLERLYISGAHFTYELI
jgi:hypothetical protein